MPSATVLHDTLRVKVGFIIILHAQNRINYILILFFFVFCGILLSFNQCS